MFLKHLIDPGPDSPKPIRIFMTFVDRIERHHVFMMAAGIAFNIILYALPLFLVAIYVVNLFVDADNLAKTIESIVIDFLPPSEKTTGIVNEVLSEFRLIMDSATVIGYIALGVLLWISSTLISSLRNGLNTVFNLESPNIFVLYRLKDILLTIIFTVLIFLYSYAVPMVTMAQNLIEEFFPDKIQWFFSELTVTAFTLSTAFLLFYFIYRTVPNRKLARNVRILATGLSVIFIEVSRYVFAWYIGSISSYGRFYGTYAAIVFVALWIYYSSLIILLSAELSKYIFDLREAAKMINNANEVEEENQSTS